MPTVPKVNVQGGGSGVGAVGAAGVVGTAAELAMRALARPGGEAPPIPPGADEPMAELLRLQPMPEDSPRLDAMRKLVRATDHLPASTRASIQMQVLSDPAAWGGEP